MKIESVLKIGESVFKEIANMKTPTQIIAKTIAFTLFFTLQACGSVEPNMMGGPDAGTGGQAVTGGSTGTGGEGSSTGGSGSAGTGGQVATGGQPGTGGQPATGGSTGTGGKATGGSSGTGGQGGTKGPTITSCTFYNSSQSPTPGVSLNSQSCMACAQDSDCITAYGNPQMQCLNNLGCLAVGPQGYMPRVTCQEFTAQYADGAASVVSAVSEDPSNQSCVTSASSFVSRWPSGIALCMGIPMNFSGTVLSTTTASNESDSNGNCNVTIVVQVPGANGCLFDATFTMLAQAPAKGTPETPGPFPPPSCN